MTTVNLPDSLISTLGGNFYTDPAIFALEQPRIFESMWFCAVRACRPRRARRVPDRPGGARERSDHPLREQADPRLLQRVPAPRSAAVHRGRRGRSSGPSSARTTPGPTTSTASWSRRPTSPRCPTSTGWSTGCVSVARARVARATSGSAWPTSRPSFEETWSGAVVDRLGDLESIEHYDIEHLAVGRRIVYDVQGQLEAHRRELHGVLPLRDHPPRAHRGAARVRRRLRRPVLRRPRRRVR